MMTGDKTAETEQRGTGFCWKEELFRAIDHMAPYDPMLDRLRSQAEQREAEHVLKPKD